MDTVGTLISKSNKHKRLSKWDLLRSLCMLAVVVVHSGSYLGTMAGVNAGSIASVAAILCDPLFFALSGYFAIRPLKGSLFSYYSRKVSTIILPLFVYSFLLYLYNARLTVLSIHGYIVYFSQILTPWWFIPALIPFLVVAPFLNTLFENSTTIKSSPLPCSHASSLPGALFPISSRGHSEARDMKYSS